MKIYSKLAVVIFSLFLLFSCSSSRSLYSFDYPLTTNVSKSKNNDLKIFVPDGWYQADDNVNNRVDIWLVKNDLSASIAITPLFLDKETITEIKGNINKLIEYSKAFRIAKFGDNYKDRDHVEIFTINNIKFGGYEFTGTDNNIKRVIVFKYQDKYYEMTAAFNPSNYSSNLSEIFNVQNSILKSIK